MRIFLKYIFKSMFEKKSRFFLLLISITLSTSLLVSSIGVVNVAVDTIKKPLIEQSAEKDIGITSKGETNFFDSKNVKEKGIKNVLYEIIFLGIYEKDKIVDVYIYGRENKYIDKELLFENKDLKDFNENKCIISKRIKDDLKLKVGDKVKFKINDEINEFEIYAVAKNEKEFYMDNKNGFSVIIPYSYISNKFSVEGLYNYAVAQKSEKSVSKSVEKFNENNERLLAKELFDEEFIEEQAAQISNYFYLMLTIITLMSIIIIYSSFKLIVTERIKVVGVFLSQGATRKRIISMLTGESLLYGVLGGIIGNIIGYIMIYIVNYYIYPLREYGEIKYPKIDTQIILIGMVFSILMAVLSAIIPILKINKYEVKDIILNDQNFEESKTFKKFIFGGILLFLCIVTTTFYKNHIEISPILLIMSFISVIYMYPHIVKSIIGIIYKKNKNSMPSYVFALNNIRTSKILIGNITLLFIAMLVVVIINSSGQSLNNIVSEAYENLNFDLKVDIAEDSFLIDKDVIVKKIEDTDGVNIESVQEIYVSTSKVKDNTISTVGINSDKYANYDKYLNLESEENSKIFEKFKNGKDNEVIISKKLAEMIKVKEGSVFKVKIGSVEDKVKVIGIIDGKMQYNSYFILANDRYLIYNYGIKTPTLIVFDTNDSGNLVKERLEEYMRNYGINISTFDEVVENNTQSNESLINILNIFSIMAIIISAVGILNNTIIGFINRKKNMIIYASNGMTKKQRRKMIIIESFITVIIATSIILLYSSYGLYLFSSTTSLFGVALDIKFNFKFIPKMFIVTCIVVMIATIPVLIKNRNFKLIEELKYE